MIKISHQKNKGISFFISLFLHLILIFIFFGHFFISDSTGDFSSQGKVASVYIYRGGDVVSNVSKGKSQNNHSLNEDPQEEVVHASVAERFTQAAHANINKRLSSLHRSDATVDHFLELLHNDIQAHQQYPRSALLMNRKGTVKVSFELFPDGHIEELRVAQSSNTHSLDQAGLEAVKEAVPFTEASKYLTAEKTFTVQIDFN